MDPHVDVGHLGWFAGWLLACGVLLAAGLRLPLQTRWRRPWARLYEPVVILLAVVAAVGAFAALIPRDLHLDLSREKKFTPSARAIEVVDRLDREVRLTYFSLGNDAGGTRARQMLETLARRNPRLVLRLVDPDKQPSLAETYGVKLANAAVLEADGRRITVQSTEENDIALGIQRVLRLKVITVCFVEGHGEYPVDNFEFHTHVETAGSHSHGDSSAHMIETTGHGIGRLRRALEALGYEVARLPLATLQQVPPTCSVVAVANPRTTFLPAESRMLERHLAEGGSMFLMLDLGFVVEPTLAGLLGRVGVEVRQDVVIEPASHYGNDRETVAVTGYESHPITRPVSFTFFPGVRSLRIVPAASGVRPVALVSTTRDSLARPVAPIAARQASATGDGASPVPGSASAAGRSDPDPNGGRAPDGARGPHVIAIASEGVLGAEGSPPFRAVVFGDSDFASNSFFPYMANSDLALSSLRWLVREDRAAAVSARIAAPPMIMLTRPQMREVFVLAEVLPPLLVILVGAFVWWRRR